MDSIVLKIEDLVIEFSKNNRYSPSTLFIGDNVLASLLSEIGEDSLLVRESSNNCTYKGMRVSRHGNKEVCYVQ